MKVCPQCNSSYTDETLNYCLSDGTTLVSAEFLSSSWQNEETLRDPNFVMPSGMHDTSPNRSGKTQHSINLPASDEKLPEGRSRLVYYSLGLIALIAIGAGIYWVSFSSDKKNAAIATGEPLAGIDKPGMQLPKDQEAKMAQEITQFLNSWNDSNQSRRIDEHITFYADTLQTYYKESGVDRNHVKADRLRAHDRYPSVSIQIDHIKIVPISEAAAKVTFDKTWTFKSPAKVSTGSVQQEMEMVKQEGKWLIVSEKDVQVYFINNRTNTEANSAANK